MGDNARATRGGSTATVTGFSEKDFYLAEFRGRTLGLALASAGDVALAPLAAVVGELAENQTRVLVLSTHSEWLEKLVGPAVVQADDPEWLGALWRHLRHARCAGLVTGGDLAELGRRVALRLRLAKLVWVDAQGGLLRGGGERLSFIAQERLDDLLARAGEGGVPGGERLALLRQVGSMLEGGVPSISMCSPEGLADELFTYAGSGTFFSRERYTTVRWLAIDEFEPARALIHRGVEEGYLMPRGDAELDAVLSHAFGVFVEGRYLAGIGALVQYARHGAAEIASLYTLTRFLGEGVGGHLVRFALASARELGLRHVFACTTSERVERFFAAHGFREVARDQIPPEKWASYPAERRSLVRCLMRESGDVG